MSERKAVIKSTDMPEEMQEDAIKWATEAMDRFELERQVSAHIKKLFDERYDMHAVFYANNVISQISAHLARHRWALFCVVCECRSCSLSIFLFGANCDLNFQGRIVTKSFSIFRNHSLSYI